VEKVRAGSCAAAVESEEFLLQTKGEGRGNKRCGTDTSRPPPSAVVTVACMLTVAITLDAAAAAAALPLPLVLNTPLAVSALQTKPTSATTEEHEQEERTN